MRVIVFGGAGFLGSHVADALTEVGHQVVIFDRRPSPYLSDHQTGVVGDILDDRAVHEAMRGCDVAFNYAGIADIAEASARPVETIRVNVLGNTVLLEAARQLQIKRFVFASTMYVYSQQGAFYRGGKQACELIIEDYQRAFALPYTILRYGSLYGPRAGAANWIHRIIEQALEDGRITRYGDGEEIREYIHVKDAARSSADVLAAEFENTSVIISGQQAMRVRDLLRMIAEILGNQIVIEYRPPDSGRERSLHYQMTPYAFQPKMAQKLVRTSYTDLGQGLLSLIQDVHEARQRGDKRVALCRPRIGRILRPAAIAFDFDGVLVESLDIKEQAFRELFRAYPAHIDSIALLHRNNCGISRYEKFRRIYSELLQQPLSEAEMQRLDREFSTLVEEAVVACPFVTGAMEFINQRYLDTRLFIASGTPEDELGRIVGRRGLDRYFESVFGSPVSKNDALERILRQVGCHRDEIVFIGDAMEDYQAAARARVHFIARVPNGAPDPFGHRAIAKVPDLRVLALSWEETVNLIARDLATHPDRG